MSYRSITLILLVLCGGVLIVVLVNRQSTAASGAEGVGSRSDRRNHSYSDRGSHSKARSTTRIRSAIQEKRKKHHTDSGLIYQVLRKGTGATPDPTDKVEVKYLGFLQDGTEFDRSHGDDSVTFPLNGVIKGWTEGLQLMQVGALYRFEIPPELAYGERGAREKVPPNSTLIFEVELLGIKAPPEKK